MTTLVDHSQHSVSCIYAVYMLYVMLHYGHSLTSYNTLAAAALYDLKSLASHFV